VEVPEAPEVKVAPLATPHRSYECQARMYPGVGASTKSASPTVREYYFIRRQISVRCVGDHGVESYRGSYIGWGRWNAKESWRGSHHDYSFQAGARCRMSAGSSKSQGPADDQIGSFRFQRNVRRRTKLWVHSPPAYPSRHLIPRPPPTKAPQQIFSARGFVVVAVQKRSISKPHSADSLRSSA